VRLALVFALLGLSVASTAGGVEVELILNGSGCGGGPTYPSNDDLVSADLEWTAGGRLEISYWDIVIGGCEVIPNSGVAVQRGTELRLSYRQSCPGWGEPVTMCADPVRITYRISDLPPEIEFVTLVGRNGLSIDIDG
jgi:hypothetical protein